MELYDSGLCKSALQFFSKPRINRSGNLYFFSCHKFHRRRLPFNFRSFAAEKTPTIEQPGGKMVVELVRAFNELTERMNILSNCSCRLLFESLKIAIPVLQALPPAHDGRTPLSRALSVACILADLQMDAEVISAGILREVLEASTLTFQDIKEEVGTSIVHLLHESMRVRDVPSKLEILDSDSATTLRRFCLTYYEIRAIILELAIRLDTMRHLDYLPRHHQQILSLDVLNIYAPIAHAVGTGSLSLELDDLAFQYLFPSSYIYVDKWLRDHEDGSKLLIDVCKEKLLLSLKSDPVLEDLVGEIIIKGRYKSRFSTMKKLLKDGRRPGEINDLLGLRVILNPKPGDDTTENGRKACYRAYKVIQSLWREVPNRKKDYISKPKANGYKSLHMAVDVSDCGRSKPLMEIQIRTKEMDIFASAGTASHSLYKGGLTDPEQAKRLKAIVLAAAELAALRLKDSTPNHVGGIEVDHRNHVFRLLDKNGDGKISMEELTEVIEDLGAQRDDAQELMYVIDTNSDGSLSSDEFDTFQRQVEVMNNLKDRDAEYRTMLDAKLHEANSNGLIQVYHKELGERLTIR